MKTLVSIHDLMPETFSHIQAILTDLPANARQYLVLLVVPGRQWRAEQIQCLREWQNDGLILAAHGWNHQARSIRGWYHHCHAKLISRNVAEHLSLSPGEIAELLQRSYGWFKEQGLKAPEIYVPPAWAMGSADRTLLRESPFRYFETTRGIYDSASEQFKWLPLAGFEADTTFRKWSLRGWNSANLFLAGLFREERCPVRIALHPFDFDYQLAGDIKRLLHKADNLDCRKLFEPASR